MNYFFLILSILICGIFLSKIVSAYVFFNKEFCYCLCHLLLINLTTTLPTSLMLTLHPSDKIFHYSYTQTFDCHLTTLKLLKFSVLNVMYLASTLPNTWPSCTHFIIVRIRWSRLFWCTTSQVSWKHRRITVAVSVEICPNGRSLRHHIAHRISKLGYSLEKIEMVIYYYKRNNSTGPKSSPSFTLPRSFDEQTHNRQGRNYIIYLWMLPISASAQTWLYKPALRPL